MEVTVELEEELRDGLVVVGAWLHGERAASVPSGRKQTAADIESRFQLFRW